MSNPSTAARTDFVSVHGLLLLVSFLALALVPTEARVWPVPLILPLGLYSFLVCLHPTLRSSVTWTRVGLRTRAVLLSTTAAIVASCAVLALYQIYVAPGMSHLYRYIPFGSFGGFVVGGALFCVFNAVFEEIVFRGILFDALRAARGLPVALVVTAVAFGFGHYGGYPPGWVGGVMAGFYGLVLGLLRLHSRGLGAPIVAHVFADATILVLLAEYG